MCAQGVVMHCTGSDSIKVTTQLKTSENSWEHRKTSKIIWYHPDNNWGPIIDNLVQFEEDFNSRTEKSGGGSTFRVLHAQHGLVLLCLQHELNPLVLCAFCNVYNIIWHDPAIKFSFYFVILFVSLCICNYVHNDVFVFVFIVVFCYRCCESGISPISSLSCSGESSYLSKVLEIFVKSFPKGSVTPDQISTFIQYVKA